MFAFNHSNHKLSEHLLKLFTNHPILFHEGGYEENNNEYQSLYVIWMDVYDFMVFQVTEAFQ